ncbi:MAG: class I SAM-dependent methyltransferase [Gammaproteobacteria bacterium]|nr:class I SAM-dependent methyltransferase [Gammaproteobacteria bacterium]
MQQCKAHCELRSCLRAWYATPLGGLLQQAEREQLDDLLPERFGYHLLQIGALCGVSLLDQSPIRHRILLDEDPAAPGCGVGADPVALPFASDSIDAVVLHHALEFSSDPHRTLREVERVLIPEGVAVIVGFNPYSLWGLRGWLRRRRGDAPWCGRFLSAPRVRDWLALLGFDVLECRFRLYRPPLQRGGLQRKLAFLENWGGRWWQPLGGLYFVVARKRVVTVTPLRPRWQRHRRLVGGGFAEPTSRSGTHG